MYGLDATLVDTFDYELSVGRIKTDVLTDFIFAPHYSVVYAFAAGELIEHVKNILKNGAYAPELPLTIDVPKKSGLTRPGSILTPVDRLVYQMLADQIGPNAEALLDRSRVFSYVLLTDDPEYKMFKPRNECWQNMQSVRNSKCQDPNFSHAIQADIACFFERIYQHNLINLLRSSECDSRVVNLLEKVLLAFTGNNSHGILQGMFPSDLLGNFYLASVDECLEIANIPSVRYVDDIYLYYPTEFEAKAGLVDLCRIIRREGLNLNESKTKVVPSSRLLAEETEIDRSFSEAKQEISDTPVLIEMEDDYGFQNIWAWSGDVIPDEEIELGATRALYGKISENEASAEKIERFCLPYLAKAHDDIAVEKSIQGVTANQHLSSTYCAYLIGFAQRDRAVSEQLESIVREDNLIFDWALMWPIAVLLEVDTVASSTVKQAIKIIQDSRRSDGLRGLAANLVGKHGNPTQRRLLKHRYADEPSQYVRAAILFSARYFPANERHSCLGAWGSHNITNSLIARAIRSGIS